MKATKFQITLARLLKKQGLDSKTASLIPVIIKDEKLVCEMLIWVADNNPNEEQILHWVVDHT